ncbi:MAG: gluconate kinase [Gammaproteobacteria bacterium]|nr:MAG: gluconate kinase [Gammaproteobacteria bacterium]
MGVSGCGKSSVASALAERLGYQYIDGDDYHPQANIDKMRQGIPLNDADRQGWLETLNQLLVNASSGTALACSALTPKYRAILTHNVKNAHFVFLKGDFDTIWQRHQQRKHHFFKGKAMLEDQFQTLSEPSGDNVISVDVRLSINAIVDMVCQQIKAVG